MRADTGVERDRETERETGTMLSSRDKRTERKRTDGFVEVLGRGVSSHYYQNISTRDQGVSLSLLNWIFITRVVSRFYVEKSHEDFPALPANEFGDLVEAKDLIKCGSTFTKTPLFEPTADLG